MRTCENCKERKELTKFPKDKTAPSNRSHVCLVCTRKKPVQYDAVAELETREEV